MANIRHSKEAARKEEEREALADIPLDANLLCFKFTMYPVSRR